MRILKFLLPLVSALPASAQKLAPSALQAARQHQVVRGNRVQSLAPQECVSGFIRISDAAVLPKLEALGVMVRTNIKNHILTANIPVSALEPAAALEGVERIELGSEAHNKMDVARAEAGADLVRSVAEGLDRAYKGNGVVVGVIDQGFEYTHIDFKAEDGTTPRILSAWNQTYQSTPPKGWDYGTEYSNYRAMASAGYDYKYDTLHGTHVAGIAAGADMTSSYYGIASASDLIFVTYDTTADQIVDGVKYIFDKADQLGKPCVINLSLGSHTGPHDGTSLTDQAFDALTGPGRIIVGAVGNEGIHAMHVGKVVTPESPLKVIPSFFNESQKNFICDFWGEPGKTFSIQPIVVNTLKGTIMAYGTKVTVDDVNNIQDAFDIAADGVTGTVSITAVHDLDNNRDNIYVSCNVTAQGTGKTMGLLIATEEGDCKVDGWHCQCKDFIANATCQKQGFQAGDYDSLAGEIGGTAQNVISVGSYNTRFEYTSIEGIEYAMGGPNYTMSDLSPFSSNGPTSDGRMKPEVCAPGFGVISAAQRHAINTGSCAAVTKDSKGESYYYEMNAGTSMAAPYVAGSIALWLEANPSLTPDDVRNIIRTSSRRDIFTGSLGAEGDALPKGDNRWGYGKIDTFNGLLCALNYDDLKNGIVAPALFDGGNLRVVVDRTTRQLVEFMPGTEVEVYNAAGRLVARSADLSHLPSGTYIVRLRRGTASKTQKVIL